jgi:hypothetical protein
LQNSPFYKSVKTSSSGNKGHTGWAQMDYVLNCFWKTGIGAQMHYFSTRVVSGTVRIVEEEKLGQKFKLRNTSISAWAQISRQF